MAGENLLVVDDSPTILKVVESALTRAGYRVDTALDVAAGIALARSRRPVVILLDSLIPSANDHDAADAARSAGQTGTDAGKHTDTGGLEMCRALAADATLAQTPVVLMTAKGEDLEGRYARTPNVLDYLTKPFSPDAVLAVVNHVIEKSGPAAGGGVPQGAVSDGGSGPTGKKDRRRSVSLAHLREGLAEHLERHRQQSGAWALSTIVQGALGDEVLGTLLADAGFDGGASALLDDSGPAPESRARIGSDLSGHVGAISLSEVLMLLSQEGQTGTLRVVADDVRVEVYLRKGRIDLTSAVGVAEEFLLGRFAVEAGHLDPDKLAVVLDERARATGKPPLLGRDLTARGLLSVEELKRALRRQTAELTYEVLRLSEGRFHFNRAAELPELAQEAALDIAVDALLLEGYRRVDEWRLIERDIPSFDLVFVRAEDRIADLPRGTLTRDEIAVLDALSGKSSVREVVRALRMGSFDVTKVLYRLLRTKLIRRRIQPIAAT